MRIKKWLHINVAVSVLTALVICLMLFISLHRVNRALEALNIADDIVTSVFERSTFREDYLRTNSERAKAQWFARHEQVGGLLRSAAEKFTNSKGKNTVEEMIKGHETTGKLFTAIVKNREKAGLNAGSAALSQEIENRLLTQLIMRLYDTTLHAHKLQEAGNGLVSTALRQAGGGVAGILAILIALAIANSWTMSRTIADRVRKLRDGSAVIGGGDLDHRIDLKGDDEFVELSDAFNAMTGKLRGSYHNLEMEIEERTRAEEKLREAATELQAANTELDQSRHAAINLMEDALDARRKAEQAAEGLRQSEAMYRGIGESIDYGVWVCAPDGRNTYASESFLNMVGITQERCSNFGWGDVLHPDDAERTIAAWQECVRTGSTWDIEHRFHGTDGQWHYVLARGVPIRNEQGEIISWAGINLDITELKKAEEQIKASLAEKDVMLREIHHRVKNNLQVISSLVSLQADTLADEGMREVFDDVRNRVRAMALVHEKLYQTGDLAQMNFADYAASLLQYLWRSHGALSEKVRLNLAVAPVALPIEAAVPCGLILNELAGNALKHAFPDGSGGEVAVGLELDSVTGAVCLRVSDNGVGLPSGLEWRQSRSLGLRLVQMLSGQLRGTVETGPGPGAEFRIIFPLKGFQS